MHLSSTADYDRFFVMGLAGAGTFSDRLLTFGLLELADARLAPHPKSGALGGLWAAYLVASRATGTPRRPRTPGRTTLFSIGMACRGSGDWPMPISRGLPLSRTWASTWCHARRGAAADRGTTRLDVAGRALAASVFRFLHASGRRPMCSTAGVVHAMAGGGRGVGGLESPTSRCTSCCSVRDRGVVAVISPLSSSPRSRRRRR